MQWTKVEKIPHSRHQQAKRENAGNRSDESTPTCIGRRIAVTREVLKDLLTRIRLTIDRTSEKKCLRRAPRPPAYSGARR